MMDFKGRAKRLESIDISRLAATIGCGEDHLHAVMEVETRGGGFDKHGRIKMLFEPHVFYRETQGSSRQAAIAAGLAYRRWGEKPYPSDSYDRLRRAMLIDAEAALRSCSWGLGQIMGFNHILAGYHTVQGMVEAFRDDEDTHLAGMVEFIISSGLDDELRREDWAGFARGYNGAGYAKHGYHLKLKRAFDKWQRIPDTPFEVDRSDPPLNPPSDPVLVTRGMYLSKGMRGPDVLNLQGILKGLRYPVGREDSIFGRLLEGAVRAFQGDHDLVPDGKVGELTWEALYLAEARPLREVTEMELLQTSRTKKVADQGEKMAGGVKKTLLGGLTMGTLVESGQMVSSAEPLLASLQDMFFTYWWILLVIGGLLLIAHLSGDLFKKIGDFRLEDAIEGKHLG